MPSLYLENVPQDLYTALWERARSHNHSISEEVISVLRQAVPTAEELTRRRELLDLVLRIRAEPGKPGPSAEEMLREDRDR